LTTISLPPSLADIGGGAFSYCLSLSELSSAAPVPPRISAFVNRLGVNDPGPGGKGLGLGETCVIKTPPSSVDAYKNAEGWKLYAGQITGI
jgi:hypothetical protein